MNGAAAPGIAFGQSSQQQSELLSALQLLCYFSNNEPKSSRKILGLLTRRAFLNPHISEVSLVISLKLSLIILSQGNTDIMKFIGMVIDGRGWAEKNQASN